MYTTCILSFSVYVHSYVFVYSYTNINKEQPNNVVDGVDDEDELSWV